MCPCIVCLYMYKCNYFREFSTTFFTESLYGKKQAIMIYEKEIDQLHAQVRNMKATSAAEKVAHIAKYEAMFKKSKGEIITQV